MAVDPDQLALDDPPDPPPTKMTAHDVKTALGRHYGGDTGEEWVVIPEARSGAGFDGNNRQCDLIAIHTWASRGFVIHGHEIKVSRADWRAELDNPAKADAFFRYCHRWFVVVPAPWTKVIASKGEVPDGWGLIEARPDKVRQIIAPDKLTPQALPWPWMVGWLTQVDRRQKRDLKHQLDRARSEGITEGIERGKRDAVGGRAQTLLDAMRERANELKAATGISLWDPDSWRQDEIARLFKLADRYNGIDALLNRVDSIANGLARVAADMVAVQNTSTVDELRRAR